MPRQADVAIENNFKQGLITEATGLNFPENACTETFDCVFNIDGSVERRLGYDFESDASTKTIDRTDVAVSTFLWKNVSGDGDLSLYVAQVGDTIYFWDATEESLSHGAITDTIDITDHQASGSPDVSTIECQFCSGDKYMVVTHPYCDPFRVSFDSATSTATSTSIVIQIRDFEGDTADPYAVDTRPTSTYAALNVHHKYNLLNQGWITDNLQTWDSSQTTMPSNVDVMWLFKNSADNFDASTAMINRVMSGNTPASKGHYILTLSDQDRDTASGLSGTTAKDTSYFRPATAAFFAGRVFYAGINYLGFNTDIYFTQIIENDDQYPKCYQANDPTSENLSDLLPSDGGVIRIKEAGTVYKLVSISGALIIFANNGVWTVTGSTGVGFTANDYSVQKISSVSSISAKSFVDIGGFPAWWNAEGIYLISSEQSTNPTVKSLTTGSIKTFYDAIPLQSKVDARGYFNLTDGVAQWLFRSTESGTPTEIYEYDRILNLNVFTTAWYPWRIPTDSDVTINSIVVLQGTAGLITQVEVTTDTSQNVIDDSSDNVIAFQFASTSDGATPAFKYLVSYPDSGSYKITFAETRDLTYMDWISYDDVGQDFESTFTTGYKVRGQAVTKWQPTWLNIYSDTQQETSYTFRGIWDYAVEESTGRMSNIQTITHTDTNYIYGNRRLKIRGHGKALQFKVNSVSGSPFKLIGWSAFDTRNPVP